MSPSRQLADCGNVDPVLDLTKIHNWIALTGMILIIGFVLHQAAGRIEPVRKIVTASMGS